MRPVQHATLTGIQIAEYWPRVHAFVRMRMPKAIASQLAEDIVQEAFVAYPDTRLRSSPDIAPITTLLGIASKLTAHAFGEYSLYRKHAECVTPSQLSAPNQSSIELREECDCLRRQMSEDEWEIFELIAGDRSVYEIARLQNKKPKAIYATIQKVRERISRLK